MASGAGVALCKFCDFASPVLDLGGLGSLWLAAMRRFFGTIFFWTGVVWLSARYGWELPAALLVVCFGVYL